MAFENIITNDMTCDTLAHHLDIKSLGRLCLCNRQTHSTVLRAMKAAVHPDVTSLPVTPRWTDSEKKYLQQLKSDMSLAPFRKETLTILWNDLSKSSSVTTPDCKKKHIEWLRIIVPLLTIGNMAHHTQTLTLTLDQGPFTLRLEDPTTHDIYGVICNSFRTRIGEFLDNGTFKNGRLEFEPKIENKFIKFVEGEFRDNGTLKNGRLEYLPNSVNDFTKSIQGEFRDNGSLKDGTIHTTNPAQTIEKKLLADGSYVISIANYSLESLSSIEKIVYSPQGTILQQQSPTDHLFSPLPLVLKRFLGIA